MKTHHRIYLTRLVVGALALYGAYSLLPKPGMPCTVSVVHIATDTFGERYTIRGPGWSGHMVTDWPVFVTDSCKIEATHSWRTP